MKKNIYILIFFFLSFCQSVYALENKYPEILGYEISNKSEFVDYVSYAFAFIVSISSVILIFVLIMAGIDIILAGGNPGKISEAKKRIKNGFIGLTILLFTYLILHTINPGMVVENPDLEKCVGGGIIITVEKPDEKPKKICIWESQEKLDIDGTITSTEWTFKDGDLKEVWAFKEYDYKVSEGSPATSLFQDFGDETDKPISEALDVTLDTKSIYILRKNPGLYLYDAEDFSVNNTPPFFVNKTYSDLGEFSNKALFYSFIQDKDNINTYYEAILFEDVNFSGSCTFLPYTYSGEIDYIARMHEADFEEGEASSVILYRTDKTEGGDLEESDLIVYNTPNCPSEKTPENSCELTITAGGLHNPTGQFGCDSFEGSVSSVAIKGPIGFVIRSTDGYCKYFDLERNSGNNCVNLENTRVYFDSTDPSTGNNIPVRPKYFMIFSLK
jgi:hypothetical protein